MNASDRSSSPIGHQRQARSLGRNLARTKPARVFYVDPLRLENPADCGPGLQAAARMGFNTVMIPPPWAFGADGNRLLPVTFDRVQGALGGALASEYLSSLAWQASEQGLRLWMDVDLSRVAADFTGASPAFDAAPSFNRLDPRHAVQTQSRPARRDLRWW